MRDPVHVCPDCELFLTKYWDPPRCPQCRRLDIDSLNFWLLSREEQRHYASKDKFPLELEPTQKPKLFVFTVHASSEVVIAVSPAEGKKEAEKIAVEHAWDAMEDVTPYATYDTIDVPKDWEDNCPWSSENVDDFFRYMTCEKLKAWGPINAHWITIDHPGQLLLFKEEVSEG